jgi:hypothetical protein
VLLAGTLVLGLTVYGGVRLAALPDAGREDEITAALVQANQSL